MSRTYKISVLLTLALVAAIPGYIYYINNIKYYYAESIPNLEIRLQISSRNIRKFYLTGKHIGAIGSIGETNVTVNGGSADILLTRSLFDDAGNQNYAYEFSVPASVNSIYFGPERTLIWSIEKSSGI